jgi:hypothetical protein
MHHGTRELLAFVELKQRGGECAVVPLREDLAKGPQVVLRELVAFLCVLLGEGSVLGFKEAKTHP